MYRVGKNRKAIWEEERKMNLFFWKELVSCDGLKKECAGVVYLLTSL